MADKQHIEAGVQDNPAVEYDEAASWERLRSQPPIVETHLAIPKDQESRLPPWWRPTNRMLPPHFPLPRAGDVMYLSPISAWVVSVVVHEWLAPNHMHIEVWLEYVGRAHKQLAEELEDPMPAAAGTYLH